MSHRNDQKSEWLAVGRGNTLSYILFFRSNITITPEMCLGFLCIITAMFFLLEALQESNEVYGA